MTKFSRDALGGYDGIGNSDRVLASCKAGENICPKATTRIGTPILNEESWGRHAAAFHKWHGGFFDQEMRVYRPVQTVGDVIMRGDKGLAACEVVTFTLTYLD